MEIIVKFVCKTSIYKKSALDDGLGPPDNQRLSDVVLSQLYEATWRH